MAGAANSIITPQGPLVGKCRLSPANVNYDVPTGATQLLAGQPNGARITKVYAIPVATCVASDCQLYGYDGTNYRFIRAINIAATTINAGNVTAILGFDFGYSDTNPLYLAPNEQLMAANSVALLGGLVVRCEGGAY